MLQPTIDEVRQAKRQMRVEASARRTNQPDAERLSREIFGRLTALAEYARARTVMLYLDFQSEVRTRCFVPTAWEQGKRVVAPCCQGDDLVLFRLDSFDQWAAGTWGILEPKPDWRGRPDTKVEPSELDLIVVPGLAFDRQGGRLGHGKGYYDRLLQRVRGDATKAAVCFECQLFSEVPLLPHDVRMDMVVTENAVYEASA